MSPRERAVSVCDRLRELPSHVTHPTEVTQFFYIHFYFRPQFPSCFSCFLDHTSVSTGFARAAYQDLLSH